MSKFEKAKARILALPLDYTFTEAKNLLIQLGYSYSTKGKTSGSRICFYRETDERVIMLHKPHPSDVMDPAAVRSIVKYLKGAGDL